MDLIKVVADDLDALLDVLPPHIHQALIQQPDSDELIEVILDLGRLPEARYFQKELTLSNKEITDQDIEHVVSRIGSFSGDNRAGIERTLHRISAIRNREGKIIGLTCRVGRAIFGTVRIIQDLVESGKSVLLLGRPGIGKTTMLREVSRVLADDLKKRIIVVDTSNEIAGDGDIPHPAIGHARRMQVPMPANQHAVMIEAVENHMPEVIIIDEIGTELEAEAARTIAERGVQLIGTAHGNILENLMMNPTLADLVGGIQTVTLGDEEARRRGTQKSILERKAPSTFSIVVEIQERDRVVIHPNVEQAVDTILRGQQPGAEFRWIDEEGRIRTEETTGPCVQDKNPTDQGKTLRLYLFGVNRSKLEQVARDLHLPLKLADDLEDAEMVVTSRNYYRKKPQKLRDAEMMGLPVYVLKSSTTTHLRQFLDSTYADVKRADALKEALREAEEAVAEVTYGQEEVELNPQNSYLRRLQHMLAERNQLSSCSIGEGRERRVRIFKE